MKSSLSQTRCLCVEVQVNRFDYKGIAQLYITIISVHYNYKKQRVQLGKIAVDSPLTLYSSAKQAAKVQYQKVSLN
jgi:hypothetical protein